MDRTGWRTFAARSAGVVNVACSGLLFAVCGSAVQAQTVGDNLPPAWSVSSDIILDTPMYSEGPVFDADGNFYFSLHERGEIHRLGADGLVEKFIDRLNGANGHYINEDGTHIVMSRPRIVWLDGDGNELASIDEFEGEPFAFPNDLLPDGEGGFWFTDSGAYKEATGRVFHVNAERNVRLLAEGLFFANGILLSPDGSTLYVAESLDNTILAYDVAGDLSLSGERVFARLPEEKLSQAKDMPDGMCMDDAGRLYLAHNGTGFLRVLSPDGTLLRSYRTGLLSNSNCTFGPDGALYITGAPLFETAEGAIARLDLTPND